MDPRGVYTDSNSSLVRERWLASCGVSARPPGKRPRLKSRNANGVEIMNTEESRRIGARSKQFQLWAASSVIAGQKGMSPVEALSKVLRAYGDTLKPTDVRGAQTFQT